MNDPDHAKSIPKYSRLYTVTASNYAAVCYIFEGAQYQNLCRVQHPNGTFYYNENCLARIPFGQTTPAEIGFEQNASSLSTNTNSGLIKYSYQTQLGTVGEIEILLVPTIITILLTLLTIYLAYKYIFKRNNDDSNSYARKDSQNNMVIGRIKFNLEKVLGQGSRGTYVYEGSYEKDDRVCAVKRIVSQGFEIEHREVNLLQSLNHPNLVRYLATERDPQFTYIALEKAEYTLSNLIEGQNFSDIGLSKEEICKQSAQGLQYLHNSDIVHRDIKPQNILVSFVNRATNRRRVMISDFSLSREISPLPTSSTLYRTDGTRGWMAPEVSLARRGGKKLLPSKSADIFSLGCLFYYVIFEGSHPFGDEHKRESNIEVNESCLDEFMFVRKNGDPEEYLAIMCNNLVKAMINPDPEVRPSIESVLLYPLFWTKKDQLQFIIEVSDRIEKDDELVRRLEYVKRMVIGYDWKKNLSEALQTELSDKSAKHRNYNERKLQDLLRLIRNKRNHFKECTEALKAEFGHSLDGFVDYFTSRFPAMLPCVYKSMAALKDEPTFRDYFFKEPFPF